MVENRMILYKTSNKIQKNPGVGKGIVAYCKLMYKIAKLYKKNLSK